jgi:hypothetical protein
MSNLILFADNATSTLASAITSTQTTCTVAATTGALFSNPGAGQIAYGTFQDVSGNIEIVTITARTGDTFTIVRGADGTTPLGFASGTRFEQRVTAGILQAFLQGNGGATLSGTTTLSGVLSLGSGGSIQGGEFTGALRSAPGVTSNQIVVPIGSPATASGSVILTAANISSELNAGSSLITSGMILLWSGSSVSVPSGFHICDGTNGTPNLEDKFVLGAGGSQPSSGGSFTGNLAVNFSADTTDSTVLTTAQMPSHGHETWQAQAFFTGNAGPAGATRTDAGFGGGSYITSNGQSGANPIIQPTGGGMGHVHGLSQLNGSFAYSIVPPYIALFYIMKL